MQTKKKTKAKPTTHQTRFITPKNEQQAELLDRIYSNQIVLCSGKAGTGKTTVAVGAAVKLLLTGKVNRIILTRPAVEAGEKIGFLPGDMEAKVNPYLRPLFDALYMFAGVAQVNQWRSTDILEIAPVGFMRGRTFNDAVLIADESQNLDEVQLNMILTRIGMNSYFVLVGDTTQTDLPNHKRGAFEDAIDKFKNADHPNIATYEMNDQSVRNPIIDDVIRILENKGY